MSPLRNLVWACSVLVLLGGCTPAAEYSWYKTKQQFKVYDFSSNIKTFLGGDEMVVQRPDDPNRGTLPQPDPRTTPCQIQEIEYRFIEVNGVAERIPFGICRKAEAPGFVGQRWAHEDRTVPTLALPENAWGN